MEVRNGPGLRRNLWLLPLYSSVAEFLAVAPVLVAWYLAHGLGASAVFVLQAIFAAVTLCLEVPSGFFADALGRRTALAVGAAFWPLGLLLYRLGGGFAAFAGAEATLAVAVSMQSGCLSALLFDTLSALRAQEEYQRREGRMAAAGRWGTLLASVAGGLLSARSLAWPFDLNLVTHSLLLPLTLVLAEPPRERPVLRQAWGEILAVTRDCLTRPDLRPWVAGASLLGAVGLCSLWASFLAYAAWGIPLAWYGVLFAALQLGGVAGGLLSARLRARLGQAGFLWVLALPVPALALLSVSRGPLGVVAFPLIAFAWNAGLPFFFDVLNRRTEARVRATVLSVVSLCSRLAFVLLAPLFGLAVDRLGLGAAFALLAGLALVTLGPVLAALAREPA